MRPQARPVAKGAGAGVREGRGGRGVPAVAAVGSPWPDRNSHLRGRQRRCRLLEGARLHGFSGRGRDPLFHRQHHPVAERVLTEDGAAQVRPRFLSEISGISRCISPVHCRLMSRGSKGSHMSITLDGTIMQGLGAASRITVRARWGYFMQYSPEITNAHIGTINVQLDRPLWVNKPHYTCPPIQWDQHLAAEIFTFHRIEFECLPAEVRKKTGSRRKANPRHKAWIYMAHNSPYYRDLFLFEITTVRLTANKLSGSI